LALDLLVISTSVDVLGVDTSSVDLSEGRYIIGRYIGGRYIGGRSIEVVPDSDNPKLADRVSACPGTCFANAGIFHTL
jgi:hypothetical protein